MQVSAGANIGERLMAEGARHYGTLRGRALQWLERVEIDAGRIDDKPALYSGGMQQRLQIARNLVTSPRRSFDFYNLKFPRKYELASMWRFR